jgi:ABC-2 type transport system ATP-binding protein
MLRLVIEGSAERVIRAAAPLGVKRVVSHDENLEDVFLTYYTGEEG